MSAGMERTSIINGICQYLGESGFLPNDGISAFRQFLRTTPKYDLVEEISDYLETTSMPRDCAGNFLIWLEDDFPLLNSDFDLEKGLETREFDMAALTDKFGFSQSTHKKFTYLSSAPKRLKFGIHKEDEWHKEKGKFLAKFTFYEGKIWEIELRPILPIEQRPDCYFNEKQYYFFKEWQQAQVNYCKGILTALYGEPIKQADNANYCYVWKLDICEIRVCYGYDVHGDPIGGKIAILFQMTDV